MTGSLKEAFEQGRKLQAIVLSGLAVTTKNMHSQCRQDKSVAVRGARKKDSTLRRHFWCLVGTKVFLLFK